MLKPVHTGGGKRGGRGEEEGRGVKTRECRAPFPQLSPSSMTSEGREVGGAIERIIELSEL